MAISEQWANLLEPGLREVFEIQKQALAATSRIPLLFNVINSSMSKEEFLGAGGLADWNAYEGAIEYDDMYENYKTTLTHQEYVKGFKVERKLVDDDLYNMITPQPRSLALSAMRTREKHAASVFNNAFSGSYVGGDAVSLCSSSHPNGPSNSATQDNSGTTALSADAVSATRLLMRAYEDDRGELITASPDTLLVPPELEETARIIIGTDKKVGSADNDINFAGATLTNVVVWDYLTDANNWFLIDAALAKQFLLWVDRVSLEFALDPTSDFNLEARFRGYMRYSYGWSDWRWVYGHTVT